MYKMLVIILVLLLLLIWIASSYAWKVSSPETKSIYNYTSILSGYALVLLLVIYIISGLFICKSMSDPRYKDEYKAFPLEKSSAIPRIIYSYWNTEKLPKLVEKCVASWKRHLPDYRIHMIQESTIPQYVDEPISNWSQAKTQQQRADCIRIYMLNKTGGIWLDSTIYLNESLDWVHARQKAENSEYVGFKLNRFQTTMVPVVENWFMAAVPNSAFIQDWKTRFFQMHDYNSPKEYVDHLMKTTDIQKINAPYYLSMHVAALSLLPNPHYKLSLLTAENGPFLYNHCMNWIEYYFPMVMLFHKGKESPIVKYRGPERKFIEMSGLYHILD